MPDAGDVVRAFDARIGADGTNLTDSTPTSIVERNWGTETITFTNPGGPVKVIAQVTGFGSSITAGQFQTTKVAISFDGGSTFTTGNAPNSNTLDTGDTGTGRATVAASHYRTGTPTGNIVVKSQVTSSAATEPIAKSGFLTALMVPAS